MHSCITTLLFILASSSALTLSPSANSSLRHLRPQHTFCIEPYTNQWDAGYTSIFFHHPADALFNFTMVTGYTRFYPRTITAWLREKDFHIANASQIPKPELCGWFHGEQVMRDGRQHGIVYWKPSTNTSTSTPLPRSPSSVLGLTRPQDATFATLRSILYNNAPDADRYYLMTVMLGTACGTLAFMLVFYGLAGYAALRQRGKPGQSPVDIELNQIKVRELSGAGMQRLAGGYVEGPKSVVGMQGSGAVSGNQRSAASRSTEPPPVYSVDGAGR